MGKGSRAPVGKTDFILQTLSKGADFIRSVFKIVLKKDHWSQCCRTFGKKEKEQQKRLGAVFAVMQENEFFLRIAVFTPKDSLQIWAS